MELGDLGRDAVGHGESVGLRHMLTEDFRDGFTLQRARFVDPFLSDNDRLIERILPARP